jgi:hypothetical protein
VLLAKEETVLQGMTDRSVEVKKKTVEWKMNE